MPSPSRAQVQQALGCCSEAVRITVVRPVDYACTRYVPTPCPQQACAAHGLPRNCSLAALPWKWDGAWYDGYFSGPIAVGAAAAEAFMLQARRVRAMHATPWHPAAQRKPPAGALSDSVLRAVPLRPRVRLGPLKHRRPPARVRAARARALVRHARQRLGDVRIDAPRVRSGDTRSGAAGAERVHAQSACAIISQTSPRRDAGGDRRGARGSDRASERRPAHR